MPGVKYWQPLSATAGPDLAWRGKTMAMSDGPAPETDPARIAAAQSRRIWLIAIGAGAFAIIGLIAAVVVIVGSSGKIVESFNEGFAKSFFPAMHDSCVKSATAQLADPAAPGASARVETYCTCVVDGTRARLSLPDLQAMTLNHAAEPAASTMKSIALECRDKSTQ
jgi:hypothetical protein